MYRCKNVKAYLTAKMWRQFRIKVQIFEEEIDIMNSIF